MQKVVSCHGRTASYLTAPEQISASIFPALGSSEILASIKIVIPCKEVCICFSSPTCPANVSFAGCAFCQPLPPAGVLWADPTPGKLSVSLSFYRVDLLFQELIGSPKFPLSLYRHATG
jgi:hypothetical protein